MRRPVARWLLDRQGAHVPIGLLIAWLLFLLPLDVPIHVRIGAWLSAAALFRGFMQYELTEDAAINDQAYRDIQGMVVGLVIGVIASLVYIVVAEYLSAVPEVR